MATISLLIAFPSSSCLSLASVAQGRENSRHFSSKFAKLTNRQISLRQREAYKSFRQRLIPPVAADLGSSSAAVSQDVKEKITEVDLNTFYPALASAEDKLVVLDMYTQWCGPCKLLYPKLEALAEEYDDVVFLKLDCNEKNKPLAKALGVKAVPTFKLFRGGREVQEVRGAKFDVLVQEIKNFYRP
eukprot:TRINITY_DN4007_c0_g1_i1.p1 TRINITY_DN4007_c0_g1~~TRINITY_DN4007_c0_g1_i1.p1  ORF type:complete len:187 (+),score=45.50 TRINITY_DN4007_c0_g1_i1:121-681(+)